LIELVTADRIGLAVAIFSVSRQTEWRDISFNSHPLQIDRRFSGHQALGASLPVLERSRDITSETGP
jgi:hypothetical protein